MLATTTQQLQAKDVNDKVGANHQGSRRIWGYVFFFYFFFLGFLMIAYM